MSKRTFEAYSTLQESHVPEYCPGWTCLGAILGRSLGFWWLNFRWLGSPKDSLSLLSFGTQPLAAHGSGLPHVSYVLICYIRATRSAQGAPRYF
jgi:hypothetical protein